MPKSKTSTEQIGEYAFILGVIIAIIAPILAVATNTALVWVTLALVILGIIVGLLNITEKETGAFLIAAIALMAAQGAGFILINNVISGLGTILQGIFMNIAAFVAPAAVIVAVKAVYNIARS